MRLIGPTTVMWASDYPHPDSTYPESQRVIDNHFSKITPEQKRLVTFDNARRIYNLPEASVFAKWDMSVSITPGATALTRMPRGPSIAAQCLTNVSSAPFVAA